MTKRLHTWEPDEDARLETAVAEMAPYRATCEERGWPMARFWDAIAGRMAPALCVSGKACYERWKRLQEAKPEPEPVADGWTKAAALVEEYERDLQEAALDGVNNIIQAMPDVQMVARIEAKIDRLLAELGVKP